MSKKMHRSNRSKLGAAPAVSARRRGISVLTILISLLIVALGTIAVASTLVALRATQEKKRAVEDFNAAHALADQYVGLAATSSVLKGSSLTQVREEIYKPAMAYYEKIVQTRANDDKALAQVADAYFHLAGLQAKLGSRETLSSINGGLTAINKMKKINADAASYPSIYECAWKNTIPPEWFTLRGASAEEMRGHLAPLVITIDSLILTCTELSQQYPDAAGFREDMAGAQKVKATMFGFANLNKRALDAWQQAANALEKVVQARPNDVDVKIRYAEALAGTASRQKTAKQLDEAAATLEKTVAVREQIVAALPEDRTRQQELTTSKRELERIKATKPAQPKAPAADSTATDASAAPEQPPATP
jgi:tetratricopeptide (TPR) repeat protein